MTDRDLEPRATVRRWLASQRVDKAEQTVSAYWYRLKHFVEWCEAEEITSLAALDAWAVEDYLTHRRGRGLAAITAEKEFLTLQQFFDWVARYEGVADGLPEWVDPPSTSPAEQTSDTLLPATAAQPLLDVYRAGGDGQYRREHVVLELLWYTGCRPGALRGLDVGDVDTEAAIVAFQHRPDTGTPLKNAHDGERPVRVPARTASVVDAYLQGDRHDVVDEHGRHPLITTRQGRISPTSLQNVCYYATVPCRYQQCPHGNQQATCEWWGGRAASGCPSSRSPHQIRTGSITWQRSRGIPDETIATRVNSSPSVIRRHYDKPTSDDLLARQDPHLSKLTFDDEQH